MLRPELEILAQHQPSPKDCLSVCPHCHKPFVVEGICIMLETNNPEEYEWLVELCCSNCGSIREGVFGAPEIERFDRNLDKSVEELHTVANELSLDIHFEEEELRAQMQDKMTLWVETFTDALRKKRILPEDF